MVFSFLKHPSSIPAYTNVPLRFMRSFFMPLFPVMFSLIHWAFIPMDFFHVFITYKDIELSDSQGASIHLKGGMRFLQRILKLSNTKIWSFISFEKRMRCGSLANQNACQSWETTHTLISLQRAQPQPYATNTDPPPLRWTY